MENDNENKRGREMEKQKKRKSTIGPNNTSCTNRSKWAIDEKGKRSKWTYNLGPKRKGYSFDTSRFLFLTP